MMQYTEGIGLAIVAFVRLDRCHFNPQPCRYHAANRDQVVHTRVPLFTKQNTFATGQQ